MSSGKTPVRSRAILIVLGFVLLTLAPDGLTGQAHGAELPAYVLDNVPDFDQKRDFLAEPFRQGLPANDASRCSGDPMIPCTSDQDCGFDGPCIGIGGAMYCFPTSAVDWMAYLANNGYPQVAPGPAADWQSMDVYNLVSDTIATMGDAQHMMTNPNEGTSGDHAFAGLKKWLEPQGNLFSVIRIAREGPFCPRLLDLTLAGLSGKLVILGIGYYDLVISQNRGIEYFRDGGHLMPFRKGIITANPTSYVMGFMNPSSNPLTESTTEQGPFLPYKATLQPVTGLFDGFNRTQDRLVDWGVGTFLDAYTAICPVFAITPGPMDLQKLNPVPIPAASLPPLETFSSPSGTPIIAGTLMSTLTDAMIITQGAAPNPNQLWHLNFVTGETTEVVLSEEPKMVTSGRSPVRAAYVHCGQQIWCLSKPDFTVAGQALVPITAVPNAIAYNDATDEVLLLSTSTGELLRYPAALGSGPVTDLLPSLIAPTGGVDMVVGPSGQEIWIADQAAAAIYRVIGDGTGGLVVAEVITSPLMTSADALAINDIDQLIISNAGTILELEPGPAGGWQAAADPLFAGQSSGAFLDVVRSRTNFDPLTMTGPAWRNVLPTVEGNVDNNGIPTVSTWGAVILTLLVMTAGSLVFPDWRTRSVTT